MGHIELAAGLLRVLECGLGGLCVASHAVRFLYQVCHSVLQTFCAAAWLASQLHGRKCSLCFSICSTQSLAFALCQQLVKCSASCTGHSRPVVHALRLLVAQRLCMIVLHPGYNRMVVWGGATTA